MVQRVENGSIEIGIGPLGQVLSALRIFNDKVRQLPFVGRVEITTTTGAKVVMEPSGGFQMSNALASIHGDVAGNIQIGPVAGAGGYVVTTLSHRDYVTGLPLMGAPNVVVTQTGPGIPLPTPAPPVVPPVPSIPLPDDTEFA